VHLEGLGDVGDPSSRAISGRFPSRKSSCADTHLCANPTIEVLVAGIGIAAGKFPGNPYI
jgi:hypothetical protein